MHEADYIAAPPVEQQAANEGPARQATSLWQRIALALVLLLAILVEFYRLGQNTFGDITTSVNSYYAAAVKSMLLSWHNFFFVSFDPTGFVSVDKPPLGFWIQAASAKLFGFSPWSLLLPEALATVASVAVLYVLVRRAFGPGAALLAALALTLTPISVVAGRNNTIDSLLVLTLLLATWALLIAAETGHLRWLLLSALLVGLGFNIKMLEAYVVLPAFILIYLITTPRRLPVRLLHLILAGLVLLVVSFSWITAVDLTPASQRPYVGSTQTNSELELAIGYNGISRISGASLKQLADNNNSQQGSPSINPASVLVLFGLANTGLPGPLRLVGPLLGGQIGWLLIFALFGLIAAIHRRRARTPYMAAGQSLWLWGTWYITLFIFFSLAFFDHAYYMVTFAPAICALVGIGAIAMYRAYTHREGWRSWLLPVALIASALVQAYILATFLVWGRRLTPIIVIGSILIGLILILARLLPRLRKPMISNSLLAVGMIVLLIAPLTWSVLPLSSGNDTIDPTAGPPRTPGVLTIIAHAFIPELGHAQPQLTQYLQSHQGNAHYLVATVNTAVAAPFILDTGEPVLALGGFAGFDQILSVQQVQTLVHQGDIHFFLLPSFTHLQLNGISPRIREEIQHLAQQNGNGSAQSNAFLQGATSQWVMSHCQLVPRSAVEPGDSGPNNFIDLGASDALPTQLYDCTNTH